MFSFDGRVALVTGSSSGIGAGVAAALAAAGARVAINYPGAAQREAAEEVAQEIAVTGRDPLVVRADVSKEEDVAAMVTSVERELERIDVLINNAGIANVAPLHEMSVAQWDEMIAVHLRGVFLCTRAALGAMYARNYGRIVSTASQLAYKGAPGLTHYTAAKGGIVSFTRSLALEIGERNVTANCVAPGATRTPILDGLPAEMLEAIRQSIPKGRLAEVEDIVPAYVFLASEEARHMTGQCISPNGGDAFL
jgi:3-oxoacyl-[acyl-carrier protein] reductase